MQRDSALLLGTDSDCDTSLKTAAGTDTYLQRINIYNIDIK